METERHVLYGAPMSMFSGKARAYLRKQRIAFDEVMPGDPAFSQCIVPKTKRAIVPVLELPDGRLLQDTVDIIDHFEQENSFKRSTIGMPAIRIRLNW